MPLDHNPSILPVRPAYFLRISQDKLLVLLVHLSFSL